MRFAFLLLAVRSLGLGRPADGAQAGRDITEQVEAERKLDRARQFLGELLDHSPLAEIKWSLGTSTDKLHHVRR